ncbi:MAG: hypothetical protein EOL92_09885 [Bacteroidia bacterium]|nr:hypothetical protein [Bacteroidia bacterium]
MRRVVVVYGLPYHISNLHVRSDRGSNGSSLGSASACKSCRTRNGLLRIPPEESSQEGCSSHVRTCSGNKHPDKREY